VREVFEVLDRLGVDWFVTGSEAAACYGVLRQTFDLDVVIALDPRHWSLIERSLPDYSAADPIQYEGFAMGSVISMQTAAKVDLIMRLRDPFLEQVMDRRQRCDHRDFGSIWVCSVEDLIVAKLEWSEGTSELQLRDCAQLVRLNGRTLDWEYLERMARERGVSELAERLRDAS
jgi:hypothetical protein